MRIPMLLLLALSLCAHAAPTVAEQGYGAQQSGPAAPSTIPGRGDSDARVPIVEQAPVALPRKPKPPAAPWGNPSPTRPTVPPVASTPPAGTQTPASPSTSSPNVVVTPGQNTPPPAQPGSAAANDRLQSAYRNLESAAVSSAVRSNSATRIKPDGSLQGDKINATAYVCANSSNTPSISRIRPADDGALQPGAAFVVQGLCFGDRSGSVRVTLPTQYGRIQAQDAQILDWSGDKILAQLPGSIVKALPGAASVEVTTAGGVRGAGKDAAFEPRWQLSLMPVVQARVRECAGAGAGAMSSCTANDDTETDSGFRMPSNSRCIGIGKCFGSSTDQRNSGDAVYVGGRHYTDDDIRSPVRGSDQYTVTLEPWMRASHCDAEVTAFATEGRQDASASARFDGDRIVVDWALTKLGDPGWLQYRANCRVWVPAGLEAK